MRTIVLSIALLVGCTTYVPAPVAPSSPRNYAETYVNAVDPDADVLARGAQTVLAWHGTQLFACKASAKHTECFLVADWTPKQQPAPVAAPPATSETAKPASAPTPKVTKK